MAHEYPNRYKSPEEEFEGLAAGRKRMADPVYAKLVREGARARRQEGYSTDAAFRKYREFIDARPPSLQENWIRNWNDDVDARSRHVRLKNSGNRLKSPAGQYAWTSPAPAENTYGSLGYGSRGGPPKPRTTAVDGAIDTATRPSPGAHGTTPPPRPPSRPPPGGSPPPGGRDIWGKITETAKKNPIMATLLGAAGVGYLAYQGYQSLISPSKSGTIPASALGKRGSPLEQSLFKEVEEMTASQRANISTGTYFGILAAEMQEPQGGQAEVEVYDEDLGVRGYIDILLENNVPVEVKTISSTGLDRLSRPLEPHTSQLNFYLHARKAKYGYVMYLDGQDISRHKVFRVGYQPGRLQADVMQARQTMLQNPGRLTDSNIGWLTRVYQESPTMLRGMKHSSGGAASWDSIRPSSEYPGGALASITRAASAYPSATAKRVIPTMGMGIRKHQTATGRYKSRGCGAKRSVTNHCNGSRAYR
jgi:hypothetical protein